MPSIANFDRAAAALSITCVVHCVAMPVIAVSAPFLAVLSGNEWVHWAFALLSIAASSTVIAFSKPARRLGFLVPVSLGLALISFGLFAEHYDIDEGLPTAFGGFLIAAAHLRRLFKHS